MNNPASNQLLYQIALTLLPNVGSVLAKNLLAYCGSPEEVFHFSSARLEKIPNIGKDTAKAISDKASLKYALDEAEKELKFCDDYKIKPLFFTDDEYPKRLKHCEDSPMVLYFKGNANLNEDRVVGVIGTRNITDYGKDLTKKLIRDLSSQNILVISGLAYGVDVAAHKACLDLNLRTVGVLGHGLKKISPSEHKQVAMKMVSNGGLLTEFLSTDPGLAHNFPKRNRIVAGLCDAIVVVESAIKGGGLITANIANSYNRDVFAFPGKASDKMSTGCNFLIKTNKAALIESGEDLLKAMMWNEDINQKASKEPRQLSLILSPDEQKLYELLKVGDTIEIDQLLSVSGMSSSQLAGILLEMEMNGLVLSLPGKRYKLN
ncbi:MAG: DNA-protecting protein DprA [Bacteroidetes bacterium]|nr:DNA-protecting protein DprA [Bacteroidota bacterium]